MSDKSGFKLIAAAFSALLLITLYLVLKSPEKNSEQMIITIESSTETSETATEKAAADDKKDSDNKDISSEDSRESEEKTEEITEEEVLWVNINTASADELTKLEGIGDVIARRIIAYRGENGEFRNIEEIMKVEGIGEATFADIEPYIYVENPVYENEPMTESDTEEATEPQTEAAESVTAEASTEVISEEITETATEPETAISTSEPTEMTNENELTLEEAAPIDLNEAETEELMLLPNVDEKIAEQIIELRDEIGGFSHIYELLLVDELEQKEVSEILEFVTVGELQ